MQEPLYIEKRATEKPKALDYEALKAEGLQWIQQLSGAFWTDYNEHDPGITILEELCYAITDLAYRTGFDIGQHLLGSDSAQDQERIFYFPQEILPNNAVSLVDYRKQLFDSVFELNNVWIKPLPPSETSLTGLYKLLVDIDEQALRTQTVADITQKVRRAFTANRSLGEDLAEVVVLQKKPISLFADIEIDGKESLEQIYATILLNLASHFAPPIKCYSLGELRKEGYALDQIFEGPLLKHGFIKTEELTEKKDRILVSDLIKIMMQVKGVVNVKRLEMQHGVQRYANVLELTENELPVLLTNIDPKQKEGCFLQFFKGDIQYRTININLVNRTFNELATANKRVYRISEEGLPLPEYARLAVEAYHSIQHQFPLVYGVGEYGLPNEASEERLAQAKQLKGYLLIFEQFMTNYLAQLGNIRKLFSLNSNIKQTYFHQPLEGVPNMDELLADTPSQSVSIHLAGQHAIPLDYRQGLARLAEYQDADLGRKERWLDRLLALYGESFEGYSLAQFNYFADREEFARHLINTKQRLLESAPTLSRNRARAFDYYRPIQDKNNVAGMTDRISLLLGLGVDTAEIDDEYRFWAQPLTDQILDEDVELIEDLQQPSDWADRLQVGTTALGEGFDFIDLEDVENTHFSAEEKSEFLNRTLTVQTRSLPIAALRTGIDVYHYLTGSEQADSGPYLLLFQPQAEGAWLELGRYDSLEAANQAGASHIQLVKKINIRAEELHLVEHILLRPPVESSVFGCYLLDETGAPLLYSQSQFTFAQRRELLAALPDFLAEAKYFGVEGLANRLFEIQFSFDWKGEKILFRSLAPDESVESIYAKLKRAFDFLSKKETKQTQEKIGLYIQLGEGKPRIPEYFFSLQVSLFFPDWTVRFANPEFRQVVEERIAQNRPAHILSTAYWLSPSVMQAFKKQYFQWTDALRNPDLSAEERMAENEQMLLWVIGMSNRYQGTTYGLENSPY